MVSFLFLKPKTSTINERIDYIFKGRESICYLNIFQFFLMRYCIRKRLRERLPYSFINLVEMLSVKKIKEKNEKRSKIIS